MGFFKTYFEIDIPHGAHWWQKIAEVSRGSVAAEEQEGLGNYSLKFSPPFSLFWVLRCFDLLSCYQDGSSEVTLERAEVGDCFKFSFLESEMALYIRACSHQGIESYWARMAAGYQDASWLSQKKTKQPQYCVLDLATLPGSHRQGCVLQLWAGGKEVVPLLSSPLSKEQSRGEQSSMPAEPHWINLQ